MSDFFRLKIGAKRQVTLPQLLLERLLLSEGDELEFQVSGGKIEAVRTLKLVPLDYFDEATLSDLKARAAQMDRTATPAEASKQRAEKAARVSTRRAGGERYEVAQQAVNEAYGEASGERKTSG